MRRNQTLFRFFILLFLSVSILFFLASVYLSSPDRMLRPYTLKTAEKLIEDTDHRISEYGTHWQIRINAPDKAKWNDFYIDQIPVTIRDYKQCEKEGSCTSSHYIEPYTKYYKNPIYQFFPVSFVSWWEAENYCEVHGGTLPTAKQWETAAGLMEDQIYPWGSERSAGLSLANFDGFYQGITPAGWLPEGASPYGVLDMSGNIREWVIDYQKPNGQSFRSTWKTQESILKEYEDPAIFGLERILKGGGSNDLHSDIEISSYMIHAPYSAGFNRGFRCAYPVDQE